MISINDLYWVAGFLEGEGSFCFAPSKGRPLLSAKQVQKQPLERLRLIIGGNLNLVNPTVGSRPNTQPIWYWQLPSPGIMMTLWPLMSSKRRGQIERALDGWKAKPLKRRPNGSRLCRKGHVLTSEANYKGRCLQCDRARRRIYMPLYKARLAAIKSQQHELDELKGRNARHNR